MAAVPNAIGVSGRHKHLHTILYKPFVISLGIAIGFLSVGTHRQNVHVFYHRYKCYGEMNTYLVMYRTCIYSANVFEGDFEGVPDLYVVSRDGGATVTLR